MIVSKTGELSFNVKKLRATFFAMFGLGPMQPAFYTINNSTLNLLNLSWKKFFSSKTSFLTLISIMALLSVRANTYYNLNTNAATNANVLTNWVTSSTGSGGTSP